MKIDKYKKQLREAKTIAGVTRIFVFLRLCGAAVGYFDFDADMDYYTAYVHGDVKAARKIALERAESLPNATKALKGSKPLSEAAKAYRAAQSVWAKKTAKAVKGKPYLVSISKNTAKFANKRNKNYDTVLGSEVYVESPFS